LSESYWFVFGKLGLSAFGFWPMARKKNKGLGRKGFADPPGRKQKKELRGAVR